MLTEKCRDLEDQVRLYETLKLNSMNQVSNASTDFHLSHLSNTTHMDGSETMASTLQRELERALVSIKQKRAEAQAYQAEIDKLKTELSAANVAIHSLKQQQEGGQAAAGGKEMETARMAHLVEELQREKIELTNDLIEKNSRLDAMMDQEERSQQLRNELDLEVYTKQQHIDECEKVIEALHASIGQQQGGQQLINEYEAQLAELKLKLTNREHEVQKVREMYIEVCNDKNNLQDTLKLQYDSDYELKLKRQLEVAVEAKLDEQKSLLNEKALQERSALMDEHRKQLEAMQVDLKLTKDQLAQCDKQLDQLRLEKANLQVKFGRDEMDLKQKCLDANEVKTRPSLLIYLFSFLNLC